MTRPICATCGVQFDIGRLPPVCPICNDDRQHLGRYGQQWTTHRQLQESHRVRLEHDDGILGIGVAPAFAIDQRALVLPSAEGNILWDCTSLVTDAAVAALAACGGVAAIAISHPHFYGSMIEWSEALGDVPVFVHRDDSSWLARRSLRVHAWGGETLHLDRSMTLLRCGGHFPGSCVLHWHGNARPDGALFVGDTLQVALDRRHVSFMYSYPNYIPLRPSHVAVIRNRLSGVAFKDVHGYTWGRNIIGGARAAVDRSFARYLEATAG